jgi:hypothetical protein
VTAWVADRFGLRVRTAAAPLGVTVTDLAGLALRRNPRRAQLLVSRVLGKHVATDPRLVYASGRLLGLRVAEALGLCPDGTTATLGPLLRSALEGGDPGPLRDAVTAVTVLPSATVVLGNAETATALGHAVADALGARYLHSTRRPADGLPVLGGYAEALSLAA